MSPWKQLAPKISSHMNFSAAHSLSSMLINMAPVLLSIMRISRNRGYIMHSHLS